MVVAEGESQQMRLRAVLARNLTVVAAADQDREVARGASSGVRIVRSARRRAVTSFERSAARVHNDTGHGSTSATGTNTTAG